MFSSNKTSTKHTRLILFVLILGALLYSYLQKREPVSAATISSSSFSASSYVPSATNATYTFVFTLPTDLSSTASDWIHFSLNKVEGGGQYTSDTSFCDATVSSVNISGNGSSGTIEVAPNSFTADAQGSGVCPGGMVMISGGTIDAGSVITLEIGGITNPSIASAYAPFINDSQTNQTLSTSVPYKPFPSSGNDFLLKIKVTEPDGSTAVAGANSWIHSVNYRKSAGFQTDALGFAYIFTSTIYVPDGEIVDDTYVIEVNAPQGSSYTSAASVTVSLTRGTTIDCTQVTVGCTGTNNGPIRLTRPQMKATFKVPSDCTTCNASAGTAIPNVGVDVMDSTSFDPSNSKWAESDSSGVFKIGGLSAGTYRIEFRMPWNSEDYVGLTVPTTIENFVVNANGSVEYPADTTTLEANLPVLLGSGGIIEFGLATKTVTGTVTSTGGQIMPNVTINAWKMMDFGWTQATTDSNGEYSMTMGGGDWMIQPEVDYYSNFDDNPDNDTTASWIYCKMPKSVSFAKNNNVETSAGNDFVVQTTDATITGAVKYPNGSPVNNSASVDIFSKDGCGTFASLNWQDGTFSASVPSGTYTLKVQSWESDYGSPQPVNITVSSGTYSVGTLTLSEKLGRISGRLWADSNNNGSYDSGEGVGNARVEGFKMSKKFDEFGGPGIGPMGGGGDWASTQSSNSTSTKGNFTLKVNNGSWIINVMADMGMMNGGYSDTSVNYIYTGSPVQINITTGSTTSTGNNFELSIADATIQGRIIESGTNTPVTGVWGYAFAEANSTFGQGPMMGAGMGAPLSNGTFTIKVPAGVYRVGVDFPPESSSYTPSSMATVTAVSGSSVSADVPVLPNNATLRIRFKNSSGDLVTDLNYAEVFLDNESGGHQWRSFNGSDLNSGYTNMLVSAGTWHVGYFIDPTTTNYMSQPVTDNTITTIANQTVAKDVILQVADSTVSGTVYDPSGNTLSGVWISTDSRKTDSFSPIGGPMFAQGEVTGQNGTYSLSLPAGTYKVEAFFPPSAMIGGQTVNYLNPEGQEVTISSGSPSTVNFTFGESNATITGSITLNGSAQGAFVTAYSDKGAYNEVNSINGTYSLPATANDTWNVRAMYESGSSFYYSPIYSIAMGGSTAKTQDIVLSVAPFTIPDPVSTTFSCANAKKITLSNGAEISIPANAIVPSSVSTCNSSDASSNITISVTPTAQMSFQDRAIPIGIGYEISATDANGTTISSTFSSPVTITIPYTAEQIQTSLGGSVDESLLSNGYWDTSSSAWRSVNNQVVDTENKKIIITTTHFTLFGVIAATDPTTSSGTSSSTSTSTSSGAGGGYVLTAGMPGVINMYPVVAVVESDTLKWDANLRVTTHTKKHPAYVKPWWQVGDQYDIAFYHGDDLLYPYKTSILALKYKFSQLEGLPEKSLRIANSLDNGKTWRILPSSVIDYPNRTVAAITHIRGRYMLMAGYGASSISYFKKPSKIIKDKTTQEKMIQKEKILYPTEAVTQGEIPTPTPAKKNIFQRVLDFIFRR